MALAWVALSLTSAMPAAAQSGDGEIEEITVKGIRRSLSNSADVKRNATGVLDAISAEELGKFPDINVAESLQRITGVGITRTRGGEGQFVTVRGLGEEFNAVTYNNRLLATENNGREFSFDVIASELIAGAEVYKTPTAMQGDGSLGGRVNLRPALPLDNPGLRFAGSLAGQYEDLASSTGPRASGVFSNTFANDTMGFLVSFSYQDREARTDVAESHFLTSGIQVDAAGNAKENLDVFENNAALRDYRDALEDIRDNGASGRAIDDSGFADTDSDGISDFSGEDIVNSGAHLNAFSALLAEQQRERAGGTIAFQYSPSEDFTLTLDAMYTSFESPSTQFNYAYFPTALDGTALNATITETDDMDTPDDDSDDVDYTYANPYAGRYISTNVDVNAANQIVSHTATPFANRPHRARERGRHRNLRSRCQRGLAAQRPAEFHWRYFLLQGGRPARQLRIGRRQWCVLRDRLPGRRV